MTSDEIAELARTRKPLPPRTRLAEKQLYYVLRGIYRSYEAKELTLDEAKREKMDAIREFESEIQTFEVYQESLRRINEISRIAVKCEKCENRVCEYCNQILKIFDGRQGRAFI